MSRAFDERRYKHLCITPQVILDALMLTNPVAFKSTITLTGGLPDGWEYGGCAFDAATDTLIVRVYHESFPVLYDGSAAERIEAKYTRHNCEPPYAAMAQIDQIDNEYGLRMVCDYIEKKLACSPTTTTAARS